MSIAFLLGRIAFVAIFLVSGIFNLLERGKTAALIQSKITVPPNLSNVVKNAETATGLPYYELVAIVISIVSIVFALLIIFNILTRLSALVLFIYTAVATYFLYDFWNMTGDPRALNMTLALQNLSILGGLLMLFVIGAWRPGSVEDDDYSV
jgi:putative oxidoreductase